MLITYTNNTSRIQHRIDVNGNPIKADLGETISYLGNDSRPSNIDGLTMKVESDGTGMPIYIGYAIPGTADDEKGWAVKKRVVAGLIETWPWAGEGFVLRYIWDDRATLNYN